VYVLEDTWRQQLRRVAALLDPGAGLSARRRIDERVIYRARVDAGPEGRKVGLVQNLPVRQNDFIFVKKRQKKAA
jgi:hypothetical protein